MYHFRKLRVQNPDELSASQRRAKPGAGGEAFCEIGGVPEYSTLPAGPPLRSNLAGLGRRSGGGSEGTLQSEAAIQSSSTHHKATASQAAQMQPEEVQQKSEGREVTRCG